MKRNSLVSCFGDGDVFCQKCPGGGDFHNNIQHNHRALGSHLMLTRLPPSLCPQKTKRFDIFIGKMDSEKKSLLIRGESQVNGDLKDTTTRIIPKTRFQIN